MNHKKILFVRLSSIGDIVMTSLAIRNFRKQYPQVEVAFLTKPMYRDLVQKHLGVEQVLCIQESLWETARMIVREDFDCVVDFHANLRSRVLVQFLPERIQVLRYSKRALQRNLSVWFRRNWYPPVPVPEQYLEALKPFGVGNDGKGLSFLIPEEDKIYKKDVPMTHRSGYAVLAIGASRFTKKLPVNKWIEICREIEVPIILIGGKDEVKYGQEIAQSDELKILNRCGRYSLGQSASVMEQSLFVVTHDSGMMHIAAALDKKVISIWGGTVPYLGFAPYVRDASQSRIMEVKNLSCRPCSKYGRDDCPQGHFKCMQDIDASEVEKATN